MKSLIRGDVLTGVSQIEAVTIEAIRRELEQPGGVLTVMTQYVVYTYTNETILQYADRHAREIWRSKKLAEPEDIFVTKVQEKVQDEITKIAGKAHDIDAFRAYLKRTVKHRCLDVLKSPQVARNARTMSTADSSESGELSIEDLAAQGTNEQSPDSHTLQQEREAIIRDILLELPPEHRQLYSLIYDSEMSIRDAGISMKMDPSKIYRFHAELLSKVQLLLKRRGLTEANIHLLSD